MHIHFKVIFWQVTKVSRPYASLYFVKENIFHKGLLVGSDYRTMERFFLLSDPTNKPLWNDDLGGIKTEL